MRTELEYRKDIQGVRAVAILIVLAAHWSVPGMEFGYIGVDVFFVVSGYVITGLLCVELKNKSKIDFLNFYAARFRRLLPALLFMVCTICIVSFFVMPPKQQLEQNVSAIFSFLWINNFYLAFSEQNYFVENQDGLFMHTWSLAVEEQFYLLWPIILSVIYGKKIKSKNNLFIFVLIIFVVSLLLSAYFLNKYPVPSYYMMPFRGWQFSIGALAFLLNYQVNKCFETRIFGLCCSVISFFGVYCVIKFNNYVVINTIIIVFLIGIILFLGKFSGENYVGKILSYRLFQWIGDRSYSIYLWHWPIWIIVSSLNALNPWQLLIVVMAMTIAMSCVSYSFVENPIRRNFYLKANNKITFYGSFALILFSLFLIKEWNSYLYSFSYNPSDSVERARNDTPVIYQHGCDDWYHSSQVKPCIYQVENFEKTMVLVGDSIGAQWFSALLTIVHKNKMRLIVYTKSACPLIDTPKFYQRIRRYYTECEIWRNSVLDKVALDKPDVLIVGNGIENYSQYEWVSGADRIFSRLSESSKKVIVLSPTPHLSVNPIDCLVRKNWMDKFFNVSGMCSTIEESNRDRTMDAHEWNRIAASKYSNIYVLSLNDFICADGVCSAMKNNTIKYRDAQHLTDSFVQLLTENLEIQINAN